MAGQTISFCNMYAEEHGRGEHLARCGLWLFVGYRDKHDLHLCCDRASPLFGAVADEHDSHPWIGPPHGPGPGDVETRCFLDYLRLQVAEAEREREWLGLAWRGKSEQAGYHPLWRRSPACPFQTSAVPELSRQGRG